MVSSITRAEQVADTLRQAIRGGQYLSGERLVELTLSRNLNVSQNTVRDALYVLEAEGWVVKHARRGVHVRAFTPSDAAEVYALWSAIEGLALRWLVETTTRKDLSQLRRTIQQARRQTLNGDLSDAAGELLAFHEAIRQMCGRPQTAELLATLHNRIHLLERIRQMRAPRSPHAYEARLILHEKLISLLEDGAVDEAVTLLDYLIRTDADTLVPLL